MIEMYCNRNVASWLRLMATLEHAAEPEFSSRDETSRQENAGLTSLGTATLEGAQTETAHSGERLQGRNENVWTGDAPGSRPTSALPLHQPESGDPQVCAPSFFQHSAG